MKKSLDNSVKRMLSEIAIKTAWKKLKESGREDCDLSIIDNDDKKCLFGYTIEREENIYSARSYVALPNIATLQDANNKYLEMITKYGLRFVSYTGSLTGQVFEKNNFAIIEILPDKSNKNRRNLSILHPIETKNFARYERWITPLLDSTLGMVDLSDNN